MRFMKTLSGTVVATLAALAITPSLAETPANTLTEAEQRAGWKLLFDGQSMDHWRNYQNDSVSDGWKVTNGEIVRHAKGAGDIISKEKYGAFELLLDYKISTGGNSGLMFHVTEDSKRPWHSGPEIQIQDNVDGHDAQLAGWLYQLYQPKAGPTIIDATRPAGEWNQIYLRVAPGGCEVCVNGVRYYTFRMGTKDWKNRVAQSKFSKFPGFGSAGSGHICLQDHGNLVSFRNIKVRELADDGGVQQPIDGKLGLSGELAFPNLKWDQWEAVDDEGKIRPLRLMELTFPKDDSNRLFAASQNGGIWCFEN